MKKIFFLFVFICLALTFDTLAQCPMCRMSAETNLNDGGTMASGLNTGIIYLLSIPYLLISIISFLWWRNSQVIAEEEVLEEIRLLMEPL